ncbi:MAG: hypothetical protein EPO21_00145 [Chloroflexota bacterium]|nr:MAG: hypothetical protein EPO21_00145 [Chloroflexota bacterium]
MAQRVKPRITVTVDPQMLEEVDAYIREHAGADRSQIVDKALRCWYAQMLDEALAKQHAAPRSPEELEQRAAWKRIRTAQMLRGDRAPRVPEGE